MSSSSNNIVISPVNIFWRIEANSQIDVTGATGAAIDGAYFELNSPSTEYYIWFNLTDGASVDPAPAGKTGVQVDILTADTASAIATALQSTIDGEADFSASVSGNVVDVVNAAVGEVADPADGTPATSFSLTVCRKGKDFDLGLLEGEPSPSATPDNLPIQSQQTGVETNALIYRGLSENTVETVLQETTKSKLSAFYSIYGGSFNPGTSVFGIGTGAIGKNLLIEAARLEMVPVNTLSDELSYPYNMMLAVPTPSSLVFSGENPRTLTVSWQGFSDPSIDPRVNNILIGDPSQSGLKV